MSVGIEGELDPEEMIAGSSERLWGLQVKFQVRMLYLYNWISISKLGSYCSSPVDVPYCWKFCLLGEVPKDEEEIEDLYSSTWEQAGFNWAQVWVEEGVHWHWRRLNDRACSSRYFLEPLSFLSLFSISPLSAPYPWSPSSYLISPFSFWL